MASFDLEMVLRLVDRVSGPARAVARNLRDAFSAENVAGAQAALGRTEERMGRLRGEAVGLAAEGFALYRAIRPAIAFESAMADVNKTVGFETPEAMRAFEAELVAMSGRLPMATEGLAAIAAEAGQAGIPIEELLPWTEMTARNAVALGMAAEAAGGDFARLRSAMNLTLDETQGLADATNHLSNNMASAAPSIVEVLRRVGGASQQFNLGETDVAAFASAMLATGQEAEVVSTSILNMGRALTMGEAATARTRDGFGALGLDAVEVAARMQQDAVPTILDVLARINALPVEARAAVSSMVFGDEARALTPLIANSELLTDALALVAEPAAYAGSALREYEVRAATTENNLQLLANTLTTVSLALAPVLPMLNGLVDAVRPWIATAAEWAAANPELVGALAVLVGGLFALKLAVWAVSFLFSGLAVVALRVFLGLAKLGGALKLLGPALRIAAAAAGFLYGKLLLTGMFLLANPIVLAIAAIAGAAALIYVYWEPIKQFFADLWAGIVAQATEAWEGIGAWAGAVAENLLGSWRGVQEFFERLWSRVQSITDLIPSLPSWLGGGDAPAVGGARAAGGPVSRGLAYLVGEEGPEWIVPDRDGFVIPNGGFDRRPPVPALAAGARAGGGVSIGDVHVHAAPGMDARAVADEVMRRLREMARGAGDLHDGAHYGGAPW